MSALEVAGAGMISKKVYHGTDLGSAETISSGEIKVCNGGGELGAGFYTGDWLYAAKAWAWNRHSKSTSVVRLIVLSSDFPDINVLHLELAQAIFYMTEIRRTNKKRLPVFGVDIVLAPIVGGGASILAYFDYIRAGGTYYPWLYIDGIPVWSKKIEPNQQKWESDKSERFLNSGKVQREIV